MIRFRLAIFGRNMNFGKCTRKIKALKAIHQFFRDSFVSFESMQGENALIECKHQKLSKYEKKLDS